MEKIGQQLPENAGLEELRLQQRAHGERRHALTAVLRQFDQMLKRNTIFLLRVNQVVR